MIFRTIFALIINFAILVENIQSENAFVSIRKRGDLSSLSWMKTAPSRTRVFKTQRTELCDVTYASLNFRDVMLATGKLPPDAIPGHFLEKLDSLLGMEFSGRDSQGTSVMGLCPAKVIYLLMKKKHI